MSYEETVLTLTKQTGIGKTTMKKILAEYNRTGQVTEPNLKKSRQSFKEKIDDFTKIAIRRKVHEFYRNKELPTVDKILQVVNDDGDLPQFKRSTFHKLLHELNFVFVKRQRNSCLTEKQELIMWRRDYLRAIKKYREEGRSIYYLDETWVNAGDVPEKVWMDTTIKSHRDAFIRGLSTGPANPSGKGKRLIVLHIGSADGFVPGGLLCFESKKNTTDYHDEMNGNTFLDWFKKVLPILDDNCVIVLDNAPYHSVKMEKIPNSSWRKNDIIQWLQSKGKEIDNTMVKAELLRIVGLEKEKYNKYIIDETAKEQNKIVLRLPPYHCELNPIEMVWSMVKGYVKTNNKSFKLPEVKRLLEEGIARVTSEHWKNFIRHIIKEEHRFWEIDHIVDSLIDEIPPLIIHVNGQSDSDSSDTD